MPLNNISDEIMIKVFDEDITASDLVSTKHLNKFLFFRLARAL